MKTRTVASVFMMVLIVPFQACQRVERRPWSSTEGVMAEQEVAALHREWCRAHREYDAAWFERHIADTMVNTIGGTVTGKPLMVERVTRRATRFDTLRYDELKVQAYGDTAIATGVVFAEGASSNGRAFRGRVRFTNVWIARRGQWQCVAQHETQLGDK